jgi:hypothetical protein
MMQHKEKLRKESVIDFFMGNCLFRIRLLIFESNFRKTITLVNHIN